jgi:hypothetical protein
MRRGKNSETDLLNLLFDLAVSLLTWLIHCGFKLLTRAVERGVDKTAYLLVMIYKKLRRS